MPLYDYKNKETGELEEHFVHLSEAKKFLDDNPHLERVITTSSFKHGGNRKIGDNIDVGFKEVLNKVKEAHPLGTVDV